MKQDKIADLMKEILEYATQGYSPEALFLFQDTLMNADTVTLTSCIDEIELILKKLPADKKDTLEDIVLEVRKTAEMHRREAEILAEEERKKKVEETLGFIEAMAGKPQHITEAYDRLTGLILNSDPSEVKTRYDKLKQLAGLFFPKRRKQIEELLSEVTKSTLVEEEAQDEIPEDFSIETLIDDVADILEGGSEFYYEAYCLLCDTINAFDDVTILDARFKIDALVSQFTAKHQKELRSLIGLKTGAVSDDKPVQEVLPTATTRLQAIPDVPTRVEELRESRTHVDEEEIDDQDSYSGYQRPEDKAIEISGLKLTWHAIERTRRRGIRDEDIETVVMYGRNFYAQGAEFYVVGKKEIAKNPAEARRLLRVEGLHLVCSNGWIITTYKNRDPNRLKH